jgi:hypothetical protein
MTPGESPGASPMNSPRSSRPRLVTAAVFALLPFAFLPANAAENTAPATTTVRRAATDELVITNGTFLRDGQSTEATLRNIVDAIVQRYPQVNVTMVGAENVLIRNLRLRWGKRSVTENFDPKDVPLRGMFAALREASGRQFNLEDFSPNDFLISAKEKPEASRRVEVFNLSSLPNIRQDNVLQTELDRLETEMAVLTKRYAAEHPRVVENTLRIDTIKAQLARAPKRIDNTEKLLEEIQNVVRVTLQRIKPDEPSPEFKYHTGTGLLVVIGSESGLEVTRKVVAALH